MSINPRPARFFTIDGLWRAVRASRTSVCSSVNSTCVIGETGSSRGVHPVYHHNAISRQMRQHAHAFACTERSQNVRYTRIITQRPAQPVSPIDRLFLRWVLPEERTFKILADSEEKSSIPRTADDKCRATIGEFWMRGDARLTIDRTGPATESEIPLTRGPTSSRLIFHSSSRAPSLVSLITVVIAASLLLASYIII